MEVRGQLHAPAVFLSGEKNPGTDSSTKVCLLELAWEMKKMSGKI